MFVDSHLHLSKKDYINIDEVIETARIEGINYLIISCCSKIDFDEGLELSKKYDNIYLCLGFHPSEVENYKTSYIKELEEIIIDNPRKVIAIGEIGLDYHYGKELKEEQKIMFKEQLDLAKKLNLPVVIHTRDAVEDTIKILENYKLKGVIHCFSGSNEIAQKYIKMGYKLGIGGVVTFKNSKLTDTIRTIGVENIVLETDSPYLSPEPYRGSKNEPKNIKVISNKISEITGKPIEEIASITTSNVSMIFDLNF